MIIPAPNRELDQRSLKSLRAKWPAMWSDISKAMQGLKAHSLHMIVLDEVLGFELSNFKRQVKMKPETNEGHKIFVGCRTIFGFEMTRLMKKHLREVTLNRRRLNWKR